MADDTDQTTPDTDTQETDEPAATTAGTGAETTTDAEPHGDATDWKAQARKWEKLAKANKDKAEEADGLREKAAKADELQQRLDELNAANEWKDTVERVSKDTGTPEDVLCLLKADTADTLTEAAKTLASYVAKTLDSYAKASGRGMGDQSREPSKPRPSTEAEIMSQVNRNATGA